MAEETKPQPLDLTGQTLQEISRLNWSAQKPTEPPNTQTLQLGAMLRIADALEKLARVQPDKRSPEQLRAKIDALAIDNKKLRQANGDLKGQLTRARQKLKSNTDTLAGKDATDLENDARQRGIDRHRPIKSEGCGQWFHYSEKLPVAGAKVWFSPGFGKEPHRGHYYPASDIAPAYFLTDQQQQVEVLYLYWCEPDLATFV